MAKEAYDAILEGLNDALAYAKGDKSKGVAHALPVGAPDVRAARQRLGLSQAEFAARFGIGVGTVRNWEQRRRRPRGAAFLLLKLIEANPQAVIDVINDTQVRG